MRVIAGTARSLPLKTPEGLDVRPTTDRIKETLFNMLQWDIPGGVFVDLFSGSGSSGIEAQKAISCIQQNLTFTKMADKGVVLKQDACSALGSIRESEANIIFMDPPYDSGEEKAALAVLKNMPYVTEDTIIIVEAVLDRDFSWVTELGFTITKDKRYKTNKHIFMKREV